MSEPAAAIAASPAVAAARAALAGRSAWLVGGAVRDGLLGRGVLDADLAVPAGEEADAARAIARAARGAAVQLSAEFGTWRAVARHNAWHVDVTRLRGRGIEDDLRSRDFTVNALALPLADPAARPLDPLGAVRDLERGLLRAASERAFADDPLRLLRAARFAAALGFELEAGTLALGRRVAERAGEPAGERQLAELAGLLAAADPLRGLAVLDELGATGGVLPELEGLRGVEQNPNHHLDVHGHTLEVLRQLLAVESDLERYAGDSAAGAHALLAEPLADGFTRGTALRLGALLHDVGKPATKGERDGYVTFIGHDSVGAELVGAICARLKASRALTRHLQGLARHHLRLGFLVHERPLAARTLYAYLSACGDVAPDVTLLTAADRLSARGGGTVASPQMINAHLELVREVLPAALAWHEGGPPRAPVAGDELARELGIAPGPELGALLEELRAAAFAGEVRGRDEAVALARRRLRSG